MSANERNNRNIPRPIQREVRQRCGFGCVICGFPLYEYDHLKDWANVKEHIANDIILLCDRHHREVTSGLLPRRKVIEANKIPYNFKTGKSKPYVLHYEGNSSSMNTFWSIPDCDAACKSQIVGVVISGSKPLPVEGEPSNSIDTAQVSPTGHP